MPGRHTQGDMKKASSPLWLALATLLSGCVFTVPPRDNAQWVSTVHGVTMHWRWVTPGALGGAFGTLAGQPDNPAPRYAGMAMTAPLALSCVIDIDPALSRGDLVNVAAHEAGHCFAGHYLRLSATTEGLSPYHQQLFERYAELYAQLYIRECGRSLRPLGWFDTVEPTCRAAPDPREINL